MVGNQPSSIFELLRRTTRLIPLCLLVSIRTFGVRAPVAPTAWMNALLKIYSKSFKFLRSEGFVGNISAMRHYLVEGLPVYFTNLLRTSKCQHMGVK